MEVPEYWPQSRYIIGHTQKWYLWGQLTFLVLSLRDSNSACKCKIINQSNTKALTCCSFYLVELPKIIASSTHHWIIDVVEFHMGIFRQSYLSAHRFEERIFLKENSIQLTNDYGDKKLRRQLIAMSIKTTANWSLMPWNFTWVFLTKISVSK